MKYRKNQSGPRSAWVMLPKVLSDAHKLENGSGIRLVSVMMGSKSRVYSDSWVTTVSHQSNQFQTSLKHIPCSSIHWQPFDTSSSSAPPDVVGCNLRFTRFVTMVLYLSEVVCGLFFGQVCIFISLDSFGPMRSSQLSPTSTMSAAAAFCFMQWRETIVAFKAI